MARIDLTAARREATFVALLEGRPVTESTLSATICSTIGRYGTRRCAEIVAAEYGDHPEVAAPRMNRAMSLVAASYAASRHRRPVTATPATAATPVASVAPVAA